MSLGDQKSPSVLRCSGNPRADVCDSAQGLGCCRNPCSKGSGGVLGVLGGPGSLGVKFKEPRLALRG